MQKNPLLRVFLCPDFVNMVKFISKIAMPAASI